jgi:pyruvate/2-oxoglutarate/acetoin dehydrogenase E1 component
MPSSADGTAVLTRASTRQATVDERRIRYAEALREATAQEMARDPSVLVFGLDVDDHRGIYGTTRGLAAEFGPQRCFGTPLSEGAMTGVGIGMALAGLRPIHVHIRQDFLMLAMDQLVNIAAKAHYMWGGTVKVPLVVRSVIGKSWGQGAQHSQALQSFFMHLPGLKVVAPSTPYDAKGTLVTSIRDDNPVMFIEHRMLHYESGHVPGDVYSVPLGKARVLAEGSDVTLVGISWMAVECMRARVYLQQRGISAEVLDPVTLSPLDIDTIRRSVARTGKLVVVDTAWTNCGASAEILARIAEAGPPGVKTWRLGFAPTSCPPTPPLEQLFYPNGRTIAAFVNATCMGGDPSWSPAETVYPEQLEFKGPF